jgi:hypothetical protein
MDAGVSASGSDRVNVSAAQSLECVLHDPLYGALARLSLPPAEAAAVVVQHELHSALGHARNLGRRVGVSSNAAMRVARWKRLTLFNVRDHISAR